MLLKWGIRQNSGLFHAECSVPAVTSSDIYKLFDCSDFLQMDTEKEVRHSLIPTYRPWWTLAALHKDLTNELYKQPMFLLAHAAICHCISVCICTVLLQTQCLIRAIEDQVLLLSSKTKPRLSRGTIDYKGTFWTSSRISAPGSCFCELALGRNIRYCSTVVSYNDSCGGWWVWCMSWWWVMLHHQALWDWKQWFSAPTKLKLQT